MKYKNEAPLEMLKEFGSKEWAANNKPFLIVSPLIYLAIAIICYTQGFHTGGMFFLIFSLLPVIAVFLSCMKQAFWPAIVIQNWWYLLFMMYKARNEKI
mgnify:CR=1 FL=1|jgi:hypothetical protein